MELNIRDWMLVIGVLLLLAVALDGYRRAQRERRNQVRLSRNAKRAQKASPPEEEKNFTSELPAGGARLVSKRQIEDIDPLNPPEVESERVNLADRKEPTISDPSDDQHDETLLDESHRPDDIAEASSGQDDYEVDPLFTDPFKQSPKQDIHSQPEEKPSSYQEGISSEQSSAELNAVENNVVEESALTASHEDPSEIQPSLFDQPEQDLPVEEILVMNVLATSKEGFQGEDLLHILLACDCRFGEMNIFHRYEGANQKGKIQFSIVNLVEPGIFQLDNIKDFSTPGVSFFIRLPGPEDPLESFKAMVETAQCLVKNLGGVLKDENHSAVTEQTLEHNRQRIRDYLQRQLVNA